MTASSNNGWTIGPMGAQLHPGRKVNLAASASAGHGQAIYFGAASANANLNDGATPGLICAGVVVDRLVTAGSVAGVDAAHVHQGTGSGQAASTIANDSFTAADVLAVAFDAGDGVPGKLSNYDGDNRSIMGLCLGLDANGTPVIWAGPEASTMARALLAATAHQHASWILSDAAASTTTAERAIPSSKLHGVINRVEFVGAAVAADGTDYATITIKKYVLADAYAAGVTVATYDTRAPATGQGAIAAFTPAAFALSATAANLNKLETDVYTITVTKGGSGKQLIGNVTVNGKVI